MNNTNKLGIKKVVYYSISLVDSIFLFCPMIHKPHTYMKDIIFYGVKLVVQWGSGFLLVSLLKWVEVLNSSGVEFNFKWWVLNITTNNKLVICAFH